MSTPKDIFAIYHEKTLHLHPNYCFMDYTSWSIVKLNEEKEAFIQQVIKETIDVILSDSKKNESLRDILEKTIYQEQTRIKENPWRVDPIDELKYWQKIKQGLLDSALEENVEKKLLTEKELLRDVIDRYTRQTMGNFKINAYKFSIFIVPILFNRLLNSATKGWFKGFFSRQHHVEEKVELRGDISLIQKLAQEHTIVLVPTHFSNLDSVLIGYGLYLTKLPPFLYGAGLNLYNNKIVAYFIDRLGAYKLDRRKKNVIYLETLKMFSRISMQRDCHTLFFPGGTRSRSGAMEDTLKKGLLSTVIDAQINNFIQQKKSKIIILPMVIGYHFVLEAPSLIKEHLKKTGKEKFYLEKDQFSSWIKILNFVWKFFSKGSNIILSYGKPMDVLGNYVNEHGESMDKNGNIIDISGYFVTNNTLCFSKQRDGEYTEILAERIVEEYKIHNIVLSSQAVAFLLFQLIQKKHPSLDLFNLLRISEEDRRINYHEFLGKLDELRSRLMELEKQEKLKLDHSFSWSIDAFMNEALQNIGIYHNQKVIVIHSSGYISTEDMNLLYFYHNRLTGYELEETL